MPTAKCASCQSSFEVEGTSAVCPLCGQPAEVDLTIRVLCSCGTTLKAPPKMRGRVIACPRCTRPVQIPRGDEAEEERTTAQVGHKTRWVFALALLPLIIAIQGGRDNPQARVDRTLSNLKIDGSQATTLPAKVDLIPGSKADRAAMPRGTPMTWVYGAMALALIVVFVWVSFGTPILGSVDLGIGVLALAAAGVVLGFVVHLVLPTPAQGESTPRLLALALVAGASAELLKSAWLAPRRKKLKRRAMIYLGLAIGAGLGAGYAIQAAGATAGFALARTYWIEYITLVALQSVWGGTSALFLVRAAKAPGSTGSRILAAAAVPAGLHILFEFFHRQDLFLISIVIGLVSFALFHALHFWTEETEQEVVAGETIQV